MSAPSSAQAALSLLTDVVRDYESRGRATYAAGIKPEMQRRSPGFDERQLGFARFLEFLQFAAEQNVVTLTHRLGQPAVGLPAAESPATGRAPARSSRRPHVRPDIWRAFTNWGEWRRGWDLQTLRAIMVPAEPGQRDLPEHVAIRKEWEADPTRFVEIPGVSQEVQIAWMIEFAEAQPGSVGLLMRYALREEELKARAFSQAAREDPGIFQRWMNLRVSRTIDAIEAWKKEKGLEIDIYVVERSADVEPASPSQPHAAAPMGDEDLRGLLHAAIDRMTRAELLRLTVPLEYVVGPST